MRRRSHDGRAGVQVRPGCDHESLIRKGPVMSAKTEEKSLLLEVWDALSFSEIRRAMRVVLKHMFVKPVTFQYPRGKRTIPEAPLGALGLRRYDNAAKHCAACAP